MTSLMGELRDDIVNDSTSLPTVLRKAKVLAAELGNEDFKVWVHSELNGYPDPERVPPYRHLDTSSLGTFIGYGGHTKISNVAFPMSALPAEIRPLIDHVVMSEGIAALEALAAHPSDGALTKQWPAEIAHLLSNKAYTGHECLSAWQIVSAASIKGILGNVRNRLLDFVIELGDLAPEIADSLGAARDVAPEKVQMVFNTYVTGDSNVVAAGHDIAQDVEVTGFAAGDLEGLLSFLTDTVGVPQDAADELREAITTDGPSVKAHEPGPSVLQWSGKAMSKLGQGAWQLATSTGGSLIAQAIAQFYGG